MKYDADLNSIMKVDQLALKPVKEIVDLWNTFHAVLPESVSIAVNLNKTKILIDRMKAHPLLMQPIIRDLRYFFLVSNLSLGEKIITFHHLSKKSDQALEKDPLFIIRIFTQLSHSHGLNLIRGDICDKMISKTEADTVMRGLLAFYIENSLYKEFVVPFNDKLTEFDHDAFINEYFERFGKRSDEVNKIEE